MTRKHCGKHRQVVYELHDTPEFKREENHNNKGMLVNNDNLVHYDENILDI